MAGEFETCFIAHHRFDTRQEVEDFVAENANSGKYTSMRITGYEVSARHASNIVGDPSHYRFGTKLLYHFHTTKEAEDFVAENAHSGKYTSMRVEKCSAWNSVMQQCNTWYEVHTRLA